VQPDVGDVDIGDEKQEEKKLGKLQFSLDYDFQQNNVNCYLLCSALRIKPFIPYALYQVCTTYGLS